MEPRFEIRCAPAYNMLVENARKYGIGPRIPTVILCTICILALAGYAMWAGFWKTFRPFVITVGVIEGIVFCLPHIQTGIGCSILKKRNGGKMPEAVITFADRIICRENERQTEYSYADLTGVLHLKYSYKLRFSERRTVLVDPNSFTKGTFEEFKQFLREVRPDLVIPE